MIRLLLVDDHTLFRQGVRALLAHEPDLDVVGEAQDGEEALALVEQLAPDVVVMDMVMPGMNGLEATRRIRERHPRVKVLVLTMYDDVQPVLEAGATGYVLKRSTSEELARAVRAVQAGEVPLDPAVAARLLQRYVRTGGEQASPLTPREREVLTLIANGLTNARIAARLGLSRKTIEAHRTNIMKKLDAHDVTALVRHAMSEGLVKPPV